VEHRVLDCDGSTLIGLTLDDARELWREKGGRAEDVHIIETAPPTRPPRREDNRNPNAKRKVKVVSKPPRVEPTFGAWRVLRVVETDQNAGITLTVAREELKREPQPE
jgi:hypothetical protein